MRSIPASFYDRYKDMYSIDESDFTLNGYNPEVIDPLHDTKSIIKYLLDEDEPNTEFQRDYKNKREIRKNTDRLAPIKKKLITILHDELNNE